MICLESRFVAASRGHDRWKRLTKTHVLPASRWSNCRVLCESRKPSSPNSWWDCSRDCKNLVSVESYREHETDTGDTRVQLLRNFSCRKESDFVCVFKTDCFLPSPRGRDKSHEKDFAWIKWKCKVQLELGDVK